MSKISDKLTSLEKIVNDNEAKLNTKVKKNIVIHTFLVVAVFSYTFFTVWKIKEWTSTEATSEILVSMVADQSVQARKKATFHLRENSELLASTVVKQTIDAIPQTEETLVGVLENLVDYMANHIEKVVIPSFSTALKENSSELKEQYKDFQDDEKMEGLSLILVEMLEGEMDKYINETFISEVFKLKKQLLLLNKPVNELTNKEVAQRQVLTNWVYLTKHHEMGDSSLLKFVDRLKDEFNSILELENEKEETASEVVDDLENQHLEPIGLETTLGFGD